jgi:hypothetical protein
VVAPERVDRRHRSAHLGLVHDVVVVQRPDVHELDGDGAEHDLVRDRRRARRRRHRRGERERRSLPLAAGANEVHGDLGERGIVRRDGVEQRALHAGQAIRQGDRRHVREAR